MTSATDRIPIVGTYRGVPLHAFQTAARIEAVVKPAIDAVFLLPDVASLAQYVFDHTKPPEARIFAGARIEVAWSQAAESREIRPNVDLSKIRAATAGLNSLTWMDPEYIGTDLEPRDGRPPREVDLPPEVARLLKK